MFYLLGLILLTFLAFPTLGQANAMPDTTNTDTSKFATFYIYRPKMPNGGFPINFNIYLNDSIICRIKNNTKYTIKVYTEGAADFSLKNKKTKIKINIKFEQEYYLKFVEGSGINFVHPEQGRFEFENLDVKNAVTKQK